MTDSVNDSMALAAASNALVIPTAKLVDYRECIANFSHMGSASCAKHLTDFTTDYKNIIHTCLQYTNTDCRSSVMLAITKVHQFVFDVPRDQTPLPQIGAAETIVGALIISVGLVLMGIVISDRCHCVSKMRDAVCSFNLVAALFWLGTFVLGLMWFLAYGICVGVGAECESVQKDCSSRLITSKTFAVECSDCNMLLSTGCSVPILRLMFVVHFNREKFFTHIQMIKNLWETGIFHWIYQKVSDGLYWVIGGCVFITYNNSDFVSHSMVEWMRKKQQRPRNDGDEPAQTSQFAFPKDRRQQNPKRANDADYCIPTGSYEASEAVKKPSGGYGLARAVAGVSNDARSTI